MSNLKKIKLFETPSHSISCNHIAITGKFLLTCGIYKPKIKIYDLEAQSKLLERVIDSEPLKIVPLDGHQKLAILRNDNYIEFHTKAGFYNKIAIKSTVRDMLFKEGTGVLYIGGKNYSCFDFRRGIIKDTYGPSSEINCMAMDPFYNILVMGTREEIIFIDDRQRVRIKKIGIFDVLSNSAEYNFMSVNDEKGFLCRNYEKNKLEKQSFNRNISDDKKYMHNKNNFASCGGLINGVTSLDFAENGMNLFFTANQLFQYDIRNRKMINFMDTKGSINVKCNNKSVLLSKEKSIYLRHGIHCNLNIEIFSTSYKINSFCCCDGSLFIGGENDKIEVLFSKEMGDLPYFWNDLLIENKIEE